MIASFSFYENNYCGNKIPYDSFKRIEVQASNKVKMHIMNRDYANWQGNDYSEQVKLATCSVADILYDVEFIQEKINAALNGSKVITSEKVGDYSRNYESMTFKELQEEVSKTNVDKKIQNTIEENLWYTGLTSRRVGVV